jgi:hypothetical protein
MNKTRARSVAARIAGFLEANQETLVERLVSTYRDNPGYAALDEAAYTHDLTPVAAANCRLLTRRLRGVEADQRDVAVISESGARRVSQGIPEAEVGRAYRLWSMAVWNEITEAARALGDIESEDLVPLAALVLEHNEHAGGLASDAYEDELRGIWVQTTPLGEADLDGLLRGGLPSTRIAELERDCFGTRAGLGLTMVLVTARGAGGGVARKNDAVRAVVAAWREDVVGGTLVAVDDQVVVLLGILPKAESWATTVDEDALNSVAMAALPEASGLADAFAGISELREAVLAARNLPPRRRPYRWQETMLTAIGLAVPAAIRSRLQDSLRVVEEHSRRHGAPLLETLQVFVANNGHITLAAEELYCHANTVRYRLARITALTGLDVMSATDRTILAIALSISGAQLEKPPAVGSDAGT